MSDAMTFKLIGLLIGATIYMFIVYYVVRATYRKDVKYMGVVKDDLKVVVNDDDLELINEKIKDINNAYMRLRRTLCILTGKRIINELNEHNLFASPATTKKKGSSKRDLYVHHVVNVGSEDTDVINVRVNTEGRIVGVQIDDLPFYYNASIKV
jgi:hypothetical protein